MGQLQQFQLLAPPCPHPTPAFLPALSKSSSGWGWDRVAAHATEGVAKLPAPRGPKLPSCPWSDRSPGTGGQGVDVCEGGLGPPGALCRLLPRVPFFPDGPCAAQLSLPLLPCALGHEPRPHGGGRGTLGRLGSSTDVCGEQGAKSTLMACGFCRLGSMRSARWNCQCRAARFPEHEVLGDVVWFVASHFGHARGPSSTPGSLVTHTQ